MSFLESIPVWGWFDIGFTLLVLVALCGELDWTAARLIPERLNDLVPVVGKRKRLKKICEGLLIIGIAGEVACLPFSLKESSDANKAAKSLEQSNLELKEKLAWREISDEMIERANPVMASLARPILITTSPDPEAQSFAERLDSVFLKWGWPRNSGTIGLWSGAPQGVEIVMANETNRGAAMALSNFFLINNLGPVFVATNALPMEQTNVWGRIPLPDNQYMQLHIFSKFHK